MLLVLLKRNSEDKLMIASILQLLKVVAAQGKSVCVEEAADKEKREYLRQY